MQKELTFEDGILLCKYIYQSAIIKIVKELNEKDQILYRADEILKNYKTESSNKRLNELLFLLDLENIYSKI